MRDLFAEIRADTRTHYLATDAVRADLDQRAARLRVELDAFGVPVTADTLRAYGLGVMNAGRKLEAGPPDVPSEAGRELGMIIAAAAQLEGEVSR